MSAEVLTLVDSTGATARIAPALGFNCFSYQLASNQGPVELLWSAPDFVTGTARPSGSGIPLLFPFAGRIRGGKFAFGGSNFDLATGDGRGNAIHGFVLDRPWQVIEQQSHRLVGRFEASRVDPQILLRWPSDFRLEVSYELQAGALVSDIRATNIGDRPLPFWFGTHPYFRLPLGNRGAPNDCTLTVPVEHRWELVDLLPTGKRAKPEGPFDLAAGVPFAQTQLDDVFDVACAGDTWSAQIADAANRRTLTMTSDSLFTTCVVYNPPHRQAVCIEPYTGLPDAFALTAQGIPAGPAVLAPGAEFSARITIAVA